MRAVRWNLRMKAAERGIWKSTEMRRRLAEAGLEISAGKMSALWTGTPVTIRLEDLDVICAVLDCTPSDLLICEPDKVAARRPARAAGGPAPTPVTPRAGAAPVGAPGMTGTMRMCQVCGIRPPGDAGDPVLLRLLARRPGHPAAVPPVRLEGGLLHLGAVRPLPHPRPRPEIAGLEAPAAAPTVVSRLLPGLLRVGRDPHLPAGCARAASPGGRPTPAGDVRDLRAQ